MGRKAQTPVCHPSERYHSRGICQKCYKRDWHIRNRERMLESAARRRREKAVEIAAWKKAWRERNIDRVKANYKRWYAEKRDTVQAKLRAARERNPQLHVQRVREWRKANPERFREQGSKASARRRARKLASPGTEPTAEQQMDLRWLLGGRCYYCGECAGDNMELDHVVPLVRGGSVGVENLVPACRPCNASKNDSDALTWLTTSRRANDTRFEPARRRLRAA